MHGFIHVCAPASSCLVRLVGVCFCQWMCPDGSTSSPSSPLHVRRPPILDSSGFLSASRRQNPWRSFPTRTGPRCNGQLLSVPLRRTWTLGSGRPIPARAPTSHRLFALRAAIVRTSPRETGGFSGGKRARSGVGGGQDAVLDDHQVRNGASRTRNARWRSGTDGCGSMRRGRSNGRCYGIVRENTMEPLGTIGREIWSQLLAVPTRRVLDGPLKFLRRKRDRCRRHPRSPRRCSTGRWESSTIWRRLCVAVFSTARRRTHADLFVLSLRSLFPDNPTDGTARVAVASSKEQGLLHHKGTLHALQLCLPR